MQKSAGNAATSDTVKELVAAGRVGEAWALLNESLASNPDNHRLAASRLRFALRHGFYSEGLRLISALDQPALFESRLLRAACDFLHHLHRNEDAYELAARRLSADPGSADAAAIALREISETGDADRGEACCARLDSGVRQHAAVLVENAKRLLRLGEWDRAVQEAEAAIARLESGDVSDIAASRIPKMIAHAKAVSDSVAVRRRACALIDVSPSEQIESRGLIAIFSNGSPFVTMTTALPARELRRSGYDVLYLSYEDALGKSFPASTKWRQFSGIVLGGGRRLAGAASNGRNFAWTVDWNNRIVEANGVNFYQVVFETLCNRFRRFSIDISDPVFSSAFEKTIDIADTILAVCMRLYEVNRTQKQPIRILAGAPHLVPAGVFRRFCETIGHDNNMEFVVFKPSYEHYFSNMTNTRITKLAIENMTRFRDTQRLPVFARREQFENWLSTAGPYEESWEKVRGVLKLERLVTDQRSKDAEAVLHRVKVAKQEGRPIVCVFGKILYDISEPEQGGPAHRDIREWINDTISIAGSSEALFLIKPHPSETKISFGTPTERFTDLIHVDLPDNVIVLEHRWFNLPDLTPFIDLGVVWAGTTALELGALGIPCIVCNKWGLRDHPIAFPYPKDREDYKAKLEAPLSIAWPDGEAKRCVRLLDYLSHEDFMISYPYAQIPMRGIDKAPKVWNEEELERYLSDDGDRHVSKIVARIAEGA